MTRGFLHAAVLGLGLLLFAATMVYPAGAAAWTFAQADGSIGFSNISWRLLAESAALAFAAAVLATLVALPAALVIAAGGGRSPGAVLAATLAAPVLFPPMVYVFGWQSVLHAAGRAMCVAAWVTWIWPLPAAVLAAAWSRRGRALLDAARLDASVGAASWRIVVPVLAAPLALSVLLVWALLLGEYTTPHACGLIVYATDLLARVESTGSPVEVFAAATPGAVLISVLLAAAALAARARRRDEELPAGSTGRSSRLHLLILAFVAFTVGTPLVMLARRVALGSALSSAVDIYGLEVFASIGCAVAAGVLAVLMGVTVVAVPSLRRVGLGWGILWAALPGALVGELLVTACLRVPLVYDTPALTVFGWTARYGWIGIAAGWLARSTHPAELEQAAAVDGAGPRRITLSVALASQKSLLAAASLIVATLSLSDVATTSLVRSPRFTPIAMVVIEKFHRLEDDMLVALSLLLVAAALPAIAICGIVAARGRDRSSKIEDQKSKRKTV